MNFESGPLKPKDSQSNRIEGREAVYQVMKKRLAENAAVIDRNLLEQSDERKRELAEKAFRKEKFFHGNLELEMVGVAHVGETIPLFREELEKTVKETDFSVLETDVEVTQPQAARGKTAMSSLDDFFFLELERMAKKFQKPIVLTDPGYGYGNNPAQYQRQLEMLNEKVRNIVETSSFAGVVTGAIGATSVGFEAAQRKKMTRRDFLKLGASAAIAGAGLHVGITNQQHEKTIEYRGDRSTVYSLTDYRDVMIAEGIDRLSLTFTKRKKAALFFGRKHIEGIKQYLSNPELRKAKLKMYTPYLKASTPEISAYEFQVDERVSEESARRLDFGEWKRVMRQGLSEK